ncbi:fibrous sheath CABYR-binding protein [Erethizon dorsatum]
MEKRDEPDQPISGGRQEIRKRRHPSQPMVDKSLQTEVTEKKKLIATQQSSGPKATSSIGHIPASKGNYSAEEHESHRISSQLQQSWTKRKNRQEMADKSLQTDTIIEEKKEINLVDETVVPEEKPADIREANSELPEQVQKVEIPTSKPSVQLKVDRSQQTSCTGDMLNFRQVEKIDRGQQTSFGGFEVMAISSPTSSFTKSQDAQKDKSSGNFFVSEHPEFQPETSNREEITQKSVDRASFTQDTKKDTPVLLEDGSRPEVTIPVGEGSSVEKGASADIEDLPTEKTLAEVRPPTGEQIPAEVQPLPADEATAKVEPSLAEETLAEAAIVTAEASAKELPLVESSPVEEPLLKKPPDQVGSPSTVVAPLEAFPAEIQLPLAEMSQVEVLPPIVEDAHEEASAKVEPTMAEETPAQVQSPSAQEAFAEEVLAEIQPPSAEEGPTEEAPGEFQSPTFEEAPEEEAPAQVQPPPDKESPLEEKPAEVQSLPADEAPAEEAPAQVKSQLAEVTPAQVQSSPDEEAPAEEAPAEVQSPPADQAPAEEGPAEVLSPPADQPPAEEGPAEVLSPPL